ncbi:asparagine synthase (glutamine-hydrolyzing) [Pelagibius marinus]|uniref:asparagine synthase (glutamine-hydrolyzing) n=1 Tax=Pelagibius marinus TaxID=2762760 RepID=UPI0018725A7A|nr:asparagine synthase (glutamine-hydrolyzing) [Pelagibius marinus]
MCGIAGFLGPAGGGADFEALARRMADSLVHRGPDDGGSWADGAAGVGLGHRRLSIIDLSAAGHQPMVSANGRYVLSYNGEVYNAAELRRELEAAGVSFRGASDTEVLVEAIARHGLRPTLERLIGMFAFALWDRELRELTLVRDRLGIKPLYWGRFSKSLLFASELSALQRHPDFSGEIDRDSLCSFLRFNYVPAPQSIYRGIQKLRPGHLLSVRQGGEPQIEAWWSLAAARENGAAAPFTGSEDEAISALEDLLGDAVEMRMIADVPFGAFLSGGVDSSIVAALMNRRSSRPVRSFSIGFAEDDYNEAAYARAVADHLGTEHTELRVTPDEARAVIPNLPDIYDEPFADASQIPTFLVSRMTREHVTVALSGDGGDELFGGYNRYYQAPAVLSRTALLPEPLGRYAAALILAVPPTRWSQMLGPLPKIGAIPMLGEKLHKIADILGKSPQQAFCALVSQWPDPAALVTGGRENVDAVWSEAAGDLSGFAARMQFADTQTYLPDDILTKVDRASMAVSLEARVPLLDHRVVEFAWSLPQDFKIRGREGKWILRQVLDRHVPRTLIERPKMGFSVPIDSWLRGPLRGWAEDLLSESRLKRQGFLDPAPIRARWGEHISGKRNWQYSLWGVLMFSAWLDQKMA